MNNRLIKNTLKIQKKTAICAVAFAMSLIIASMLFTNTGNAQVKYPVPAWYHYGPVNETPSPWFQSANMNPWYNVSGCSYNPTSSGPESSHILWITSQGMSGLYTYGSGPSEGNAGFDDITVQTGGRGVYAVAIGGRYITVSGAVVTCYDEYTGEILWTTQIAFSMASLVTLVQANPPRIMICGRLGITTQVNVDTGEIVSTKEYPYEVIALYDGDVICRGTPGNREAKSAGRINSMYRYTTGSTPQLVWGPTQGAYRMTCINEGVLVTHLPAENYLNGIDVETGLILWERSLVGMSVGASGYGYYYTGGVDQAYYAIDVHTGDIAWRTPVPGSSFWSENYASIGGGYVGCGNYDGKFHVFDAETGEHIWEYYTGNCPYDIYKWWFGTWMVGGGSAPVGADGKIYASTGEHSSYETAQIPGQLLMALDLETGNYLWEYPNRLGGHNGRPIIADGLLFTADGYTNRIHCFGKGPTTTEVTVTAPQIAAGGYTVITGKVLDQSPAQPGTPAIAEESMDAWMAYLHAGKEEPAIGSIIGVDVQLIAVSTDGTVIDIGTVTCDSGGMFRHKWTPPSNEAIYTITANFIGDESYYGSWAATDISVTPAGGLGSAIEPQEQSMLVAQETSSTPSISTVAIIGVVAAGSIIVLTYTKFRKQRENKGGIKA